MKEIRIRWKGHGFSLGAIDTEQNVNYKIYFINTFI